MTTEKFGFRVGDRVEEYRSHAMSDEDMRGLFCGSGHCTGIVAGFESIYVLITRDDGYEGGGTNGAWLAAPRWVRKISHEIYFIGDTAGTAAVESDWKPDELDREKYEQFMRTLGG